ncbi:LOW QUALITY PROTEIN: sugar transporter ERD6-like 5 [Bombus impatiens]|uniref:LOW QUALITY PROTEIN: sugar transporter ERD6-like 5 n=1 Tax=Bombus impatiens TaxID=132113 RepID=A0A6P8M0X2_BOMIM|nr:LOW QUALITY PROTEIN: sugar transporter ERD6-like 5 [Bombus impatiens]
MVVVGTVYGWTTISLPYLISGTGGVPLTLTPDESSWMVSLTVLGSMFGSLLAAQLADRIGRKDCLLLSSTICTIGWFTICVATSVPMLYIARVLLGIGVGIARTINPMFVSEVADINIRGTLGTIIAVNVYAGALVTCALGIWLTYKYLLVVLILISFTSIVSNMCFPETPYFLAARGKNKQACKSIAYYKGIVDPERVKIELRDLRAQTRYELHPKSRYELHQQSSSLLHSQPGSDLPSQSRRSDLPPQPRSDFPSQSRRDLTPQSSSDLPSQPRSDLPSQSRREAHSDSFWEVVDTEPMSAPSSTDSLSQPTSVIHTDVICDVHQQPTGELHRPSASEIHRPSTSEINQPSTNEINPDEICEIQSRSTSDLRIQSSVDKSSDFQSSVDSRESTDIDEIYMDGTEYTCMTKLQTILHQSNRKALIIMLGMIMAQQLSGNFITTQYLEVLLNKTTIVIDPQEASVLVQFFSLASGTLTIITVELIGRRTFLLISTAGSCLTLNILATYLLLVEHKYNISNASIVPVIDLIIYQIVFQLGLGTLSNVLLCDLFPTELKGFVGAIIVIFDGIIGFTVSKLYQVITDNVGSYAIYFIFTTSCFLAYIAMYLWIPETKGKTYREIKVILVGENLNSPNEEIRTDEMDSREI